jgi:hypothetical protein
MEDGRGKMEATNLKPLKKRGEGSVELHLGQMEDRR